jgi:hypothetical protein
VFPLQLSDLRSGVVRNPSVVDLIKIFVKQQVHLIRQQQALQAQPPSQPQSQWQQHSRKSELLNEFIAKVLFSIVSWKEIFLNGITIGRCGRWT